MALDEDYEELLLQAHNSYERSLPVLAWSLCLQLLRQLAALSIKLVFCLRDGLRFGFKHAYTGALRPFEAALVALWLIVMFTVSRRSSVGVRPLREVRGDFRQNRHFSIRAFFNTPAKGDVTSIPVTPVTRRISSGTKGSSHTRPKVPKLPKQRRRWPARRKQHERVASSATRASSAKQPDRSRRRRIAWLWQTRTFAAREPQAAPKDSTSCTSKT